MRVNVEGRRAKKSDESLIAFASKVNRQGGGRRNGSDDRNPGRERFLHDLERRASTHDHDMILERQEIIEERTSDCFIDGIVAANVFPQDNQVAVEIKDCRRMDATGPGRST